ncbi:MAG: PEGA domain-containing protein [Bacteroidota bacterium]
MKSVAGIIIFIIVCSRSVSFAQNPSPDSTARITIESLHQTIDVFDDLNYIGCTPLMDVPVKPGLHIFRFSPGGTNAWMTAAVTESLTVAPGDSLFRSIELPPQYQITSDPDNAAVMDSGMILGYTPAMLWFPATTKNVTLSKSGYENTELSLTGSGSSFHGILKPLSGTESVVQTSELVDSKDHNNLHIYATASLAIVSGVVAAITKIKADHYYDDYLLTGNEGNIPKIHSYDKISGISMFMEELSLVTLSYLLLRQ